MVRLGKDIDVMPIKLVNKYSTKELNELYLKINELLYFYSTLYITPKTQAYLINKIVEYGKQLKNITWPMNKGERKNELRTKLGIVYKALSSYYPTETYERIQSVENNMNKYITSKFLKDKQNGMTDDIAFKYIKTIRQFAITYKVASNLISVQNECLDYLKVKETLL